MKEQIKKVLKKLDDDYNSVYDKAVWCNEHNFKLEAISLHEQANTIRKIWTMISTEFDIE